VAAFPVLIGHAASWLIAFEPSVTFVHYLSFGPAIGMPLFFVLSGFVSKALWLLSRQLSSEMRAIRFNLLHLFTLQLFARSGPRLL
jgi:hypothetical protein